LRQAPTAVQLPAGLPQAGRDSCAPDLGLHLQHHSALRRHLLRAASPTRRSRDPLFRVSQTTDEGRDDGQESPRFFPQVKITDFEFSLPAELIAQRPLPRRDESRMMVVWRESGRWAHRFFYELPEILSPE